MSGGDRRCPMRAAGVLEDLCRRVSEAPKQRHSLLLFNYPAAVSEFQPLIFLSDDLLGINALSGG